MTEKQLSGTFSQLRPPFCDEFHADCSFERKSFLAERITSTLFHDEILCAGEVMFVPRGSE